MPGAMSVFAITLSLSAVLVSCMSPVLLTQGHDPCFPMDTPDSTICHATRCIHLFNISSTSMIPTPQSSYPQNYTAFSCSVDKYEEYVGYAARMCKKPTCTCKPGYNKYNKSSCSPGKLADCWNHTCVPG